jgi:hypothetical protein
MGEALFCCRECKDREEMLTHIVKKEGRTYCDKYNGLVQAYLVKEDINESENNTDIC